MEDATKIAQGIPVTWEKTYPHPKYGDITFKGKMPNATLLAKHSIEMDKIILATGYEGDIRPGTAMLVAALAGFRTILEMPVVEEKETTLDEETGHKQIERIAYDPNAETDEEFLDKVWKDFSRWRGETNSSVGKVKTALGESSATTPATIGPSSPDTTPVPSVT
jgi:hypothetical protein